jgi:hypothetical protein
MKKFLFLLIFWASCWQVYAQNRYNYFTIGGQFNSMNYFGDLNPTTNILSTNLEFTRPNFGFTASYKATPRFSFRANLLWGRLKGDDFKSADPNDLRGAFYRYTRNLHFRNDIIEFSLGGMWDFIPNSRRFYRRKGVTPYVFGSVAVFYHNPKAKVHPDYTGPEAGKWVALRPLKTEGQGKEGYEKMYSPVQITIPFGAGVKFKVADRIDLSFETGLRLTFTDYLDDVSTFYPNPNDLDSDLARFMSNRSAEPTSAISGEARDISLITNNLGFITITPQNAAPYQSARGYGQAKDIRGKSNSDFYLVTGFHINYIFAIKRYRPFVPKEK